MPPTFYVTDSAMLKHRCEWDPTHIEVPERLQGIMWRIATTGLEARCTRLPSRFATEAEIVSVHTLEYYNSIKASKHMDLSAAEKLCTNFEELYINKHSYNSAMLSAGCALTALDAVLKNKGANGFAAIRPPGHHASPDAGCGFCIFNNIAICAKEARKKGLERVLIIDWDVHPGQGTQYCIAGDPGIKLVSIHRYEDGLFWPNLPESGVEQPFNNTINVPLDAPGYGDFEYAAFIDMFVRPIITEYKPELILVSCGFDAGFGDCEGEMRVTPAGFAYMTGTLASLEIPLLLLFEGGYFIDALPFHAEYTIRALIKRTPHYLPLEINENTSLSSHFLAQLFGVMERYQKEVSDFKVILDLFKKMHRRKLNCIVSTYKGAREFNEPPYPTRGPYPPFAKLRKFRLELFTIILPLYQHPKEREELEFSIDAKGQTISIIKSNNKDEAPVATITLTPNSLSRKKQILFCYYLVYLPLNWTFSVPPWEEALKIFNSVKGSAQKKFKINVNNNRVLKFLEKGV